ncbi:hypothetical protein JCM19238_5133 [Vibrio ponticus]|nr:hypothetical protein JCM19238_5133 [Vibrio ponticus]
MVFARISESMTAYLGLLHQSTKTYQQIYDRWWLDTPQMWKPLFYMVSQVEDYSVVNDDHIHLVSRRSKTG